MGPKIKSGVIAIFAFVFISLFLVYSLQIGKPDHQLTDGFDVTIKGEVVVYDDDFDKTTKPSYVTVYRSYYNLEELCTADEIKISKITWNDMGDKGEYIITFRLPVEQEIIITSNCNGCLHERVYVSKSDNIKEINLNWSTAICRREIFVFEDSKLASKEAVQRLNDIDSKLSRWSFNESIKDSIKNDIHNGRDEIAAMDYSLDENESLYHATKAILFSQKAYYKLDVYDLGNCLENIEKAIETHDADCYILPYAGFVGYKSSNSSFFSFLNGLDYLDKMIAEPLDLKQVNDYINGIHNNLDHTENANRKCKNSLKLISASLEYQEVYCKRMQFTLDVINCFAMAVALVIGIMIGKIGRRWDE